MPISAVCKLSGATFEITDRDLEFYKKIDVPPPQLSPSERRKRRFIFRNERFLYKRPSSLSGKEFISCVHPDEPWKTFTHEEWFGDGWDPMGFGKPYDFSRPFFAQYLDLQKQIPVIGNNAINNENCPYVNYAASCKNCHLIFGSVYCEDCMYGNPYYCKSCIDSLLVRDSELCYDCVTCEKCYECFFCQDCVGSHSLIFCYDCHGSKNCIGSVGLRNKEYCIFNKQYSREQYEELVPRIIEQMKREGVFGEFFHPSLSLFCYNETVAQEYFPLTREEALSHGYRWRDKDPKDYSLQTVMVPDDISKVSDSITNEILACGGCAKNFRVETQEVKFYKQYNLPIPKKCPDCRHKARLKLRNPRMLFDRTCTKCASSVKTTYSAERPEQVYCEKCYLKTVY